MQHVELSVMYRVQVQVTGHMHKMQTRLHQRSGGSLWLVTPNPDNYQLRLNLTLAPTLTTLQRMAKCADLLTPEAC